MLLKANGTLGRGVVEMSSSRSYIDIRGSLYLEDKVGQAITTSRIVLAYQSGDMSIIFKTRSGSTYEVVCERNDEFTSSFFSAIAECVDACMPGFEALKYCQLAKFFRPLTPCYG